MANHQEIGTLWNGGWDDYVVDTEVVIQVTEAEAAADRHHPLVTRDGKQYVRVVFSGALRKQFKENEAVLMLQHTGGGD